MFYKLTDLLTKMGAPEVLEKKRIEWHYFDDVRMDLAGYAEVRLEAGGKRLIAELRQTRENVEDDDGVVHTFFEETIQLEALRQMGDSYKVTKVAFDGKEYDAPERSVIELALSVFHARALDISIRMVEQAFNKEDMFEPSDTPEQNFQRAIFSKLDAAQKQSFGVVIPFRPRATPERQVASNGN